MEKDSEQKEERDRVTAKWRQSPMSQRGSPVSFSKKLKKKRELRPQLVFHSFRFSEKYFYASFPRTRRTSLFYAHFFHIPVLSLENLPVLSAQIQRSAFTGVDVMHTTTTRETGRESYPMTENSKCGVGLTKEKILSCLSIMNYKCF